MGETVLVQAELAVLDEFWVLSEVWEMFSLRRVSALQSWKLACWAARGVS